MSSKLTKNYIPEILALKSVRKKPSVISVNLTDKCNQNCIYCEIGKNHNPSTGDRLTTRDVLWIIDQMNLAGIPKISFCGGEPFLFEGIFEVIAYAGEKKIRTTITTNGMTVYKLNGRDLDILRKSKTEINVSIDSFDDEINSCTRGTHLALLNALKSIKILQQNDIPVTVLSAISKYNVNDLCNVVIQAVNLKITQVLFQPIIIYSNFPERPAIEDKSSINVDPGQLKELKHQLRNILVFERKNPVKTNVYRIYNWIEYYIKSVADRTGELFFEQFLHKFYCREVYAIIDITYDGGIQPCGLRPASISIKNRNHKSLIELWLEATQEIRKDIKNGKFYKECNGCCHHFSRNMLASMVKYPLTNRRTWMEMMPLIISRFVYSALKKL